MRNALVLATVLSLTNPSTVLAQNECAPPPGGVCLSAEQRDEVKRALEELKDIHDSKAQVTFETPIVIVREWDGRVYVNGGEKVPLRLRLRIGNHVDRDLMATVDTMVHYRNEPPDPMFRLRWRAHFGVLHPQLVEAVKADVDVDDAFDAGIGFDFFHVDVFNLSAHLGVRSVGITPGIDLTKNFGTYVGYALAYDGFRSGVTTGLYFSFN